MTLDIQQQMQQRMQTEAMIHQFVAETAKQIYCNIVAHMTVNQASPDGWREAANYAAAAAPYLAERMIPGFQIKDGPPPNQTDSAAESTHPELHQG